MPKSMWTRGLVAISVGAVPPVFSVLRDEYVFSRVDLLGVAVFFYGLGTTAWALVRSVWQGSSER